MSMVLPGKQTHKDDVDEEEMGRRRRWDSPAPPKTEQQQEGGAVGNLDSLETRQQQEGGACRHGQARAGTRKGTLA